MIGLRLLVVPLAAAAMASMVWHHEIVRMPLPLWICSSAVLASSIWMRWLVYRHPLGATLRQALGGILAYVALTHVITVASLSALIGREVPWQRTDKFKPASTRSATLAATSSEALLALACLGVAAAGIVLMPYGGIALSLALGVAWQGAMYAAAPSVALIAENDIREHTSPTVFTRPTAKPQPNRAEI
jgi:hypothetical protein